MATSSIKIYRTHITPTRNALVDDIEDYLGSLTPVHQDDTFQYLKLGLDLKIIVNVGQSAVSNHTLGNYCRIVEDNKIWYYFILDCVWKSQSAVELKLSIDSINTFRNDLTWDDKTTIARQHEDRLTRYGSTVPGQAIRIIDKQPEKITATKFMTSNVAINQSNRNFDWYLMYRTADTITTENPNSAVNCYLFASQPLTLSKSSAASQTFTYSDLIDGYYYFFTDLDNPGGSISLTTGSTTDNYSFGSSSGLKMMVLHRDGTTLSACYYEAYEPGQHEFVLEQTTASTTYYQWYARYTFPTKPFKHLSGASISTDPGTFTTIDSATVNIGNMFRYGATDYSNIGPYGIKEKYPTSIRSINAGSVERKTIVLEDIDRTDSRIVKIIKLPYAPIEVTYSGGIYTFPSDWEYENGLMKLKDISLSTELSNNFYSYTPVSPLVYTIRSDNRSVHAPRSIGPESKLYNSDFYTFKYVYDSFGNEIRWENFDAAEWDEDGRPAITFTFKPTNTINSRFDFYANYAANGYYKSTQDFEGHLLINRNNEETVFSNDFLNYIRTGYNYDKKAKEQTTAMGYVTAGLSLVGAVVSFAASTVTGGVSAAAGVALATSAIAGFAGAATNQASNERQMESKLESLRAQSTGVAGADDVDLMSYYSDNRMRLVSYYTESVQRQAVYELFFHCGYAHNAIAVPDLTSRYWFNYIMCKPVFKEEGVTPYNDYIDDIKSRYQVGVTVYHHHYDEWDWDQQYENWETSIAEAFGDSAMPPIEDAWVNSNGELNASMTGTYAPSSSNTYRYELSYINVDDNRVVVGTSHTNYWQLPTEGVPSTAKSIQLRLIDTSGTYFSGPYTVWYVGETCEFEADGHWYYRNPCRDGSYEDEFYYGWYSKDDPAIIGLTKMRNPQPRGIVYDFDTTEQRLVGDLMIDNVAVL